MLFRGLYWRGDPSAEPWQNRHPWRFQHIERTGLQLRTQVGAIVVLCWLCLAERLQVALDVLPFVLLANRRQARQQLLT